MNYLIRYSCEARVTRRIEAESLAEAKCLFNAGEGEVDDYDIFDDAIDENSDEFEVLRVEREPDPAEEDEDENDKRDELTDAWFALPEPQP